MVSEKKNKEKREIKRAFQRRGDKKPAWGGLVRRGGSSKHEKNQKKGP